MKKILYALLAVAATLSFASCNENIKEENGPENPIVEENTLSFKLAGAVATRSASGIHTPAQGITIPVGDPVDGQQFYLEETVTSLDDIYYGAPETKGTPVYTENFSKVSGGSFKGLAFPVATMTDNTQASPFISEGDFTDTGKFWKREFQENPFGNHDALLFYGKMTLAETDSYTTAGGVLNGSIRYLYNETEGQSMTFSYRSPFTAQEQEDILFAARTITKAEASSPFPLLFYHALTGVKFATAHTNAATDKVKTYIKSVEFTGIYGTGKCTVKPVAEDGDYLDNPTNYSSESAISWSALRFNNPNAATTVYSQDFSKTPVTYSDGGSFSSQGSYPSSFSAGGNENNLNDGDGTMTFWFIPQTMIGPASDPDHHIKVKITFDIEVKVGNETRTTEYTRDVDFGELLSNVEWKPGQLRTYTLKAEEVDVDIHDKVTGFEKTDVVITNTGNVDAYIRALIVANWWGNAGTEVGIAMGYSSDEHTTFITPWERTSLTGDNYGGVFDGLPGDYWVLADDGYFYYTKPVAPGEETGYSDGGTYKVNKLFTKYSMNTTEHPVPEIWYFDGALKEYTNVFLQMEIPVQAIQAKSGVNWDEAWGTATGTTPTAVAP